MMGMIRLKIKKLFVFISLLKFSYPFSGKEANSNLSEYGLWLGTDSRVEVMLMLCARTNGWMVRYKCRKFSMRRRKDNV